MSDRKLFTDTTVTNPENGQSQTFPAGTAEDDLPEWATDRIDNESVWDKPFDINEPSDVEPQHTGDYADSTVQELMEEAHKRNLEVPSGARKADLIAALEADDASDGS